MDARFGPIAADVVGIMARIAGWRPDEAWAATPADVAAVLAAWLPASVDGVDRPGLAAMMEQFPDG